MGFYEGAEASKTILRSPSASTADGMQMTSIMYCTPISVPSIYHCLGAARSDQLNGQNYSTEHLGNGASTDRHASCSHFVSVKTTM